MLRVLKEEESQPDLGSEKIEQEIAVYMGPEKGPFRCDNCERFKAPRSCSIVEGDIDPKGCCNLFDPED